MEFIISLNLPAAAATRAMIKGRWSVSHTDIDLVILSQRSQNTVHYELIMSLSIYQQPMPRHMCHD